ncbi:hypothetical protein GOBAR_AA02830 [Gossypium barbadense]|uniref:Uncharacterized protein n=1 Tax=Gossypium barbadense TaxID=3634 RepID=A0A2P5YQA9_GOSBA|nr:hypothetical protein GOBAR_AA02830 [Gossypium barbadense]
MVVEVGFHNHSAKRRGYHGGQCCGGYGRGRAGHDSRGLSFPKGLFLGGQKLLSMKQPYKPVCDSMVAEKEPKVSSYMSHVRVDVDGSISVSFGLMVKGEGYKVCEIENMPLTHAPQEVCIVNINDASAFSSPC